MPSNNFVSWLPSANDPSLGRGINHLPFTALTREGEQHLAVGVGDQLLDLFAIADLLHASMRSPDLSFFFQEGHLRWAEVFHNISRLMHVDGDLRSREKLSNALLPSRNAALSIPFKRCGYTDFYASIHHAKRVGQLFRPDQPLLPNYKYVPIAYNGRASSVIPSGRSVRRPKGQTRPKTPDHPPSFGPTAALDYEVEAAFVIGKGNHLGESIPISEAAEHIFGITLLNDWSARDIQAWEYQPLGPFLGKSFGTSISPYITPWTALTPFLRRPHARPDGDPEPLSYLQTTEDPATWTLDIQVEASLITHSAEGSLCTTALSFADLTDLYWTPAQMIAHHTVNGCNLMPGDILGTGTISGADPSQSGSLLELTRNGTKPLALRDGTTRGWLQDGDEVVLRGTCQQLGSPPIFLGECRGAIIPALP